VWWKWALERTVDQSPLLDTTGENCDVAQSGGVWFLAGAFGGSYTRACTVAPGTRLFLPVANAFCAAEGGFAAMRECASSFLEGAAYSAEIDGEVIPDLDRYRALSPEFALNLPDGNVFSVPEGEYAPAAADGIYLMLNPLTPGAHIISVTASFADGTTLQVTYYLTVVSEAALRPDQEGPPPARR
jgi:hypothetical protein